MIKIGNHVWLLFSLATTICSGAPFLRLALPSGEIVSHVAAQQPVLLELVSEQPLQRVSTHESIAPFVSQTSQASSYKSINGVASREYIHRWHLVFPKPHVVTVGPLIVTTDSGSERVPALVITVVPPHDHAPIAQIEYDQRPVVVGEWCSANLVFVVPAGAPCSDLSCPVPDSIALRVDQPRRSRIVRSGKPMDEIRYRIEWMAKTPGSFVLGPAHISYAIQPQGMFGFLGRFAAEQVQLSTDRIPVVVDRLPAHDGPVHAVGDIQKVFIKTAHAECARGTGISVDLCVIGSCTFLGDPAELLPSTDAYSVYVSHHEQVPGAARSVYTVKPERDGTLICSMPDFTFFNTRTRQYETIIVEPLVLQVISPTVAETAPLAAHSDARDLSGWLHLLWYVLATFLVTAFLLSVFLFFVPPLRLVYGMCTAQDADSCARLYGEMCSMLAHGVEPYEAAQKLLNAGTAPLAPEVAHWYLERRYAQRADWQICRDAARKMSVGRFIATYAFVRLAKVSVILVVGLLLCLGIYRIGVCGASYERCIVAQGTPLYYLPKKDPALCVGSVAADGEAVILEKRDQWIFVRCAVQRGWVDCSESATPGG